MRRALSTLSLSLARNHPYAGSGVQERLQYAFVSSDFSTCALRFARQNALGHSEFEHTPCGVYDSTPFAETS